MAEIIRGGATATATTEAKVVKKESFTAMLDAVTILDTAREQARAILQEAERAREQVLDEARLHGEAEGLQRYLEAVAALGVSADAYYASAEIELARLSTGIARKIIGEDVKASPETVAKIVREALASVRQARRVTLKVDPSHVEALREGIHTLELSSSCDIQVTGNTSVGPAGCLIESDLGLVDARLETQLRVIERMLLSRRSASS